MDLGLVDVRLTFHRPSPNYYVFVAIAICCMLVTPLRTVTCSYGEHVELTSRVCRTDLTWVDNGACYNRYTPLHNECELRWLSTNLNVVRFRLLSQNVQIFIV